MAASYDSYFETGLYDNRYPRPNRRVLRAALASLAHGGRFLDYGAGTGRYCFPLLAEANVQGVAADISRVARQRLAAHAAANGLASRLRVIDGGAEDVLVEGSSQPFDLCMMTFGVLGHVDGKDNRLALLKTMRRVLRPGGRLLIGLPSAARRFKTEQRKARPQVEAGVLEPGDILYGRRTGSETIPLYYHLYSPAEIRADLALAGFRADSIEAESMLPEHAVVSNRFLGLLDDVACRVLPTGLAYGFLVTATVAEE